MKLKSKLQKGEWTVCSIHTSKKQKKSQQIHKKEEESIDMLGSFENSYIPENPRTPPISYISQTVIPIKKTDFGTLQNTPIKKFHVFELSEKKKSFFRKFFLATGLVFERFLAPRSRFFEQVNEKEKKSEPKTVAQTHSPRPDPACSVRRPVHTKCSMKCHLGCDPICSDILGPATKSPVHTTCST
ncbi:hypothetical protein LXL04_024959 [Taraxacum kok-saghyz]